MTAYAVNPYKGSEDATGWNSAYHVAKYNRVLLFTRKNNQAEIDRFRAENPRDKVLDNMSFFYFDLPNWVMRIKKISGRRGYVIYYWFWQYYIVNEIKKLQLDFDVAHSLNFHSDSQPHFMWKLGKPTVWGPIGHHPKIEKEFLRPYPIIELIRDRLYYLIKWSFRKLDPNYRKAVERTDHIIGINSSVQDVISVEQDKFSIIPAVASELPNYVSRDIKRGFTVLSCGRFVPMKGFDLTIESFAKFIKSIPKDKRANIQLKLVGKGKQKGLLERLVVEQGISEYVSIVDWVERSEMMNLFNDSSVFLFPSHEGAGMVIPEALSYGIPVVCLNNVGPGELIDDYSGVRVASLYREESIVEMANALMQFYCNPDMLMYKGTKAKQHFNNHLTWTVKAKKFNEIYDSITHQSDQGKSQMINYPLLRA
ncbi:MAG: glycosyltransferase involved in cell wall biosynthesis [Parvicellaceae bacterium]|jgi:glycosyltransferase involved in cell wall biosynthesis